LDGISLLAGWVKGYIIIICILSGDLMPAREGSVALMLIAALVFYILFLVVPLIYILSIALHADPFSLVVNPKYFSPYLSQEPLVVFERPEGRVIYIVRGFNYGVIPNSLIIASITTVLCLLIGTILALVMSRYVFPLKGLLSVLLYIPMLPAPFVNAFVAFKLFDPVGGLIPWLLVDLLGLPWGIGFQEMAGVILAQIMAFYPIAFINISASMLSQDPSAEEQAINLGGRGFTLFRTVTFPLSLPGFLASASTIFIFSLEDLGGPIAFKFRYTISYEIYSSFRQAVAGSLSPVTALLALILLAMALSVFIATRELAGRRRYALAGKGGRVFQPSRRPGPLSLLAIYIVIIPLIFFTSLPQVGVFIFALAGSSWLRGPLPLELGFGHVLEAFSDPVAMRALYNSIIYSLSALAIMILVSICVAYPSQRMGGRLAVAVDSLAMSALTIPGLVIALGYLYYFMDLTGLLGLSYQDSIYSIALSIIIAYSVRKAPFVIRATYAGIQQIPESLEEAALNLGSRRAGVIARITMPLAKLSIVGGALVGWVYAFSEVSVSVTLGGLAAVGINHAAPMTFIMSDYIANKLQAVAVAASLGVILIITEIIAIAVANYITRQRLAIISI
jgi:ABC-type Fe3+ transport system permease subunit